MEIEQFFNEACLTALRTEHTSDGYPAKDEVIMSSIHFLFSNNLGGPTVNHPDYKQLDHGINLSN